MTNTLLFFIFVVLYGHGMEPQPAVCGVINSRFVKTQNQSNRITLTVILIIIKTLIELSKGILTNLFIFVFFSKQINLIYITWFLRLSIYDMLTCEQP